MGFNDDVESLFQRSGDVIFGDEFNFLIACFFLGYFLVTRALC